MSDEQSKVPWFAWALATLLYSGVAWGVVEAAKQTRENSLTQSKSQTKSLPPSTSSEQPISPRQPEPTTSVIFKIHDQLYQGQLEVATVVLIDGKNVGTVSLNPSSPESTLKVTVPKVGKYSYTLYSVAVQSHNGTAVRIAGNGQGMINVDNNDFFFLRGQLSGNTWVISLEKG